MTETDRKPEKKSDKKIFIIAIAVFVALAVLSFVSAPKDGTEVIESDDTMSASSDEADLSITDAADFNLELAAQERVLGDPRAPIKISEYASFTCGHCGNFHKNVFPRFKAAYIDTGRAYLVFSDFPLNAPALHASKIARCVPNDRYFDFVGMLFKTQDDWAHEAGYLSYIKKKAKEFGVGSDLFSACLKNKELEQKIIGRIQAAQQQWQINSTPSFVINNQEVITGSRSFEDFDKAIQDAVATIEASARADEREAVPESASEEPPEAP